LDILDAGSTPIRSLPVEIGNLSLMRLFRMTFNELQGDITAPFAALRAGAPGLANLFLSTTSTCPTVSDPSLAVWLDSFNSGWDRGCS
jgi:hypothetical protein